jgi:lysozyme
MKARQIAIDLIKSLEGCRLVAYRDEGGVWTIGWGMTHGVTEGMRITQDEADDELEKTVDGISKDVRSLLDGVRLNENQFAALVSFTYNCGVSALSNSHLRALINRGDFLSAAEEFDRWIFVKRQRSEGLVHRRAAEKALFLTPS